MVAPQWRFGFEPYDEPPDETSYNLRGYLDRMPDEKMRQYSPSWSDEQLMEWCGDFTNEGALLLPCSEREVGVTMFRRELELAVEYRNRVRAALAE